MGCSTGSRTGSGEFCAFVVVPGDDYSEPATDEDGRYAVEVPAVVGPLPVSYFLGPAVLPPAGFAYFPSFRSVTVTGSTTVVGGLDFERVDLVDDPPAFGEVTLPETMEGVPVRVEVPVWDPDTATGALTLSVRSGNRVLLPEGPEAIVLEGTGSTRVLTLTPAAGYSGAAPVRLVLSDGTSEVVLDRVLEVLPAGGGIGGVPPRIDKVLWGGGEGLVLEVDVEPAGLVVEGTLGG